MDFKNYPDGIRAFGPKFDPDGELLPKIHLNNGKVFHESIEDPQQELLDDSNKWIAMVGQVGSGKSLVASVKAVFHSWYYPNNTGFILMESMSQMKLAAIPSFFEACPRWMIYRKNMSQSIGLVWLINKVGYAYLKGEGKNVPKKKQEAKLEEIGGLSLVVFTSFQGTVKALRKWASGNIGWYMIDQAEMTGNPRVYKALNERLRKEPSGRQAWFLANLREDIPEESTWLWQRFSEESPNKLDWHSYHEVTTLQNTENLPDDFVKGLEISLDDEEFARYVTGDKSKIKMTKAAFPDFNRLTHVIPHEDPPSTWVKGIGLDTGLTNPTAFVEVARLPSGELYFFREYEVAGEVASVHAKEILRIRTPNHKYWAIDFITMNRNRVSGAKEIEEYWRYGLPFHPATRDVPARVNRIREYMKFQKHRRNPFTGQLGSPMMFVSDKCTKLIDQIEKYRAEEAKTHIGFTNEPEKFRKYNDHLVDAMQYITMLISIALSATSDVVAVDTPEGGYNPDVKKLDFIDKNGRLDFSKVMEQARRPVEHTPLTVNKYTSPHIEVTPDNPSPFPSNPPGHATKKNRTTSAWH
ncbi:MAG: hypothetical protein F4118_00535 [Acidimicrobiaceae bacterium]|nr:hypothetical protein [Candidatus Poribacteria bacterium]MYI34908.1 hypothetical protein [Acidimicrobiaceae bacterium]